MSTLAAPPLDEAAGGGRGLGKLRLNAERFRVPALTGQALAALARRPAAPTGHAELDGALGGGWPAGQVSELVGHPRQGKTGLCAAAVLQ